MQKSGYFIMMSRHLDHDYRLITSQDLLGATKYFQLRTFHIDLDECWNIGVFLKVGVQCCSLYRYYLIFRLGKSCISPIFVKNLIVVD